MKRFLISLYFAVIYITAYGNNENALLHGQFEQATGEKDNNEKEKIDMENSIIKLTVNGCSFTVTLVKNSSTDALKSYLAKESICIRMTDYGNMEKVGSLGFSLPRNDRHITTRPGDLILYQGNSLVIYYDTNSWRLTQLGHVDGVSTREKMLELLGGTGEITLTLSLNKIQDEE